MKKRSILLLVATSVTTPMVNGVQANTVSQPIANVGSTGLPYAIVDTAQEDCYNIEGNLISAPSPGEPFYGQDAQHRGNQPSYVLSADGLTVTDNQTGLIWQQRGSPIKLTYWQALDYVQAVNSQGFAGFSDWRLPSIKELYSLMDFRGTDPSSDDTSALIPFIDDRFFWFAYGDPDAGDRVIDSQWVSSTVYVADSSTVFGVNFADGRIKGYGMNGMSGTGKTFEVRLVRGNNAYGINQFINNGNLTISDTATGLMWMQNDSALPMDWSTALAWVEQVNVMNYLGYNDWRLPNAKELQSIVDYSRSPDTTGSAALDSQFNATSIINLAGDTEFAYYWTSTTHTRMGSGGGFSNANTGSAGEGNLPPPPQGPANSDTRRPPFPGGGNAAQPPANQNAEAPVSGGNQIIGNAGVYICFGRGLGSMNGNLVDIHGAGCQRSDPKTGNESDYPSVGNGPQGDVQRVFNLVRLVRDI